MNITMEGKVIIVTGGATGMGRETALLFGREGAKVAVVTAKNVAGGQAVVQEIKDSGGEAIFIQCDIAHEDQVERMVDETVKAFGHLDFAFNNAGVGPDEIRMPAQSVADQEEKFWDEILDTNLKGTYLCMKHEIRQLIRQGQGGAIVNTGSLGGIKFVPTMGAYAASKSGLIGLSKTAAIPLRRLGTAKEVALNVVFLCSDRAAYITGQAICLDGGNSAGAAKRGGVG